MKDKRKMIEFRQVYDKTDVLHLKGLQRRRTNGLGGTTSEVKCYERTRLHQLIEKLTSLPKLPSENITEYKGRAEACQYDSKQDREAVTDCVSRNDLEGFARQYETFVTLLKFSCQSKCLMEIKRDLIIFNRTTKMKGEMSAML